MSVGALGGIAWWASRQHAPHVAFARGSVAALVGALGLYAVATALRAERWHRILVRSRLDRGRAESYRLTTVGYMGNNVLPARAGDLLRCVMLGGPRRAVLGTAVAERLLDVAALAAIFAAVVVQRGLSFGPLPYVAAALAAVLALAALAVRLRRFGRARAWLAPLAGASRELVGVHGALLLALSVAIWAVEGCVYLTVGLAASVHLGVAGALYVVALTNLSMVIPAAPGYVGTFDAAVVLALRSLSLPAVGYLLLLRFVLFVPITVVGFVFFVARRRRPA